MEDLLFLEQEKNMNPKTTNILKIIIRILTILFPRL